MNTIKFLVMPALLLSLHAKAQTKTSSDGKVGKVINKIGNKTAEIAVKGASTVADKKYATKAGPKGETIYINNKSQYYYVDDRGKKVYVSKSKLKNKPADK